MTMDALYSTHTSPSKWKSALLLTHMGRTSIRYLQMNMNLRSCWSSIASSSKQWWMLRQKFTCVPRQLRRRWQSTASRTFTTTFCRIGTSSFCSWRTSTRHVSIEALLNKMFWNGHHINHALDWDKIFTQIRKFHGKKSPCQIASDLVDWFQDQRATICSYRNRTRHVSMEAKQAMPPMMECGWVSMSWIKERFPWPQRIDARKPLQWTMPLVLIEISTKLMQHKKLEGMAFREWVQNNVLQGIWYDQRMELFISIQMPIGISKTIVAWHIRYWKK